MYAQDYLTLRLVRLKSAEEWLVTREGLFFAYQKGGAGKCMTGQTEQQMRVGDMLVVQGGAGNKLCVEKGSEMVFWCFFLRLEHLFPIFASTEISLLQAVTNSFKAAKLFPAATALPTQCHKLILDVPSQFNLEHRSQLLRIAAIILAEEFKTAHCERVGSVSVEQRMIEVFEKMSTEQLLSLSVGELAVKFGCSRRHLNRLFHQFFGLSVAALRMEMRLLKAVSLLRDLQKKIINVAEECGFNHLGLFNTCFKRRFGVSPGEWRKQDRLHEGEAGATKQTSPVCSLESKGLCPLATAKKSLVPLDSKAPQALKPAGAKTFASLVSNEF